MYGLLWRSLPGPCWLKLVIVLVLLVAVFLVLMEYVFPLVYTLMPYNDVSV